MPFFSVVIPLYNKENYIAETLKSVLAQTFSDFEVIIVNDASTDMSLSVAQSIQDNRIRIIDHPQNKGLSASRNTGIRNAKSNYIAFIDADDLWKPEFLETIRLLTNKYPEAGLFATNYFEAYPDGRLIVPNLGYLDIEPDNAGISSFFSTNINKVTYHSSCFASKKTVFDNVGYYDENITFGEDIDFAIRANHKYELAYCNKPLSLYRVELQDQMMQHGSKDKTVPDLDQYEPMAKGRWDIKRYLDFYRYIMAKEYRKEGNEEGYRKMVRSIDKRSLNHKQRLLLMLPGSMLRLLGEIKKALLKKGIVVNSYN